MTSHRLIVVGGAMVVCAIGIAAIGLPYGAVLLVCGVGLMFVGLGLTIVDG